MKVKTTIKKIIFFNKAVATIAVCTLGGTSMYLTNGSTGIGWAILGVFLIWDS